MVLVEGPSTPASSESCSRLRSPMFCPECKAEYRPGFTRCSDCDVDLVWELSSQRDRGALRTIWVGHDELSCVSLCSQLKEAGILYKVGQYPESRGNKMSVYWRYELAVPEGDVQRAKEISGLPETPEVVVEEDEELAEQDDDQGSGEASVELPAEDDAPAEEHKRDSFLHPWYPEDATVEIWSGKSSDHSLVEMSLKESRIRARIDVLEDGSRKCFVLPDDESLARKIIHEIEEGWPDS